MRREIIVPNKYEGIGKQMNWEIIGWVALGASGLLIAASLFVRKKAATAGDAPLIEGITPHPLHAWLEIAWPVFFIAAMGILTLKEVMGFAAVLLLATTITGVIWGVDSALLRSRRAAESEPVVVEMARSFFPVILIVFLLRSFLYEPFKIPSESMLPTLQVGDFILVNKFTYGVRLPVINKKIVDMGSPQRGDVMVFRFPEDPAKDFLPQSGTLLAWRPSDAVRVDHALESGTDIAPHYDSMVAKLIAHAADRASSCKALGEALAGTLALGVRTNQAFLGACLAHPQFAAGRASTAFIPAHGFEFL